MSAQCQHPPVLPGALQGTGTPIQQYHVHRLVKCYESLKMLVAVPKVTFLARLWCNFCHLIVLSHGSITKHILRHAVASIDRNNRQKSGYLAASLRGQAQMVLGNMNTDNACGTAWSTRLKVLHRQIRRNSTGWWWRKSDRCQAKHCQN